MSLEKRIEAWVREGLLEPDRAKAILAYEEKQPRHSWAMYGVAGVGVCALMSGVISIIAANWVYFSHFGKLGAYFLVLAGLGALCVRWGKAPGIVREVLITIFTLFVLAGIGLIGQLYHLESDGWSGLLLWIVLVLPVVLLADNRLLPNLWFIGFYATLGLWIFAGSKYDMSTSRVLWAIGAMYASLAFGFALAGKIPLRFIRAARTWAVLVGLFGGGYAASAVWQFGAGKIPAPAGGPLAFALAACVLSAGTFLWSRDRFPRGVAKIGALTIALSALLIFPPFTLDIRPNPLLGCIVFLLPWCGVAVAAALGNRKRLFDFAAFIIGARLVGVYFEVFGSLAATGIGLILSGGLILGAVYVWHKFRAELAEIIRSRL